MLSLENLPFAVNLTLPLLSFSSAKHELRHFRSFAIYSHSSHYPIRCVEMLALSAVQTFTFDKLPFLKTISRACCCAVLCAVKKLLVVPTLKFSFNRCKITWWENMYVINFTLLLAGWSVLSCISRVILSIISHSILDFKVLWATAIFWCVYIGYQRCKM